MSPLPTIAMILSAIILTSCATTTTDPDPSQPARANGTITLSVRMNGSRSRDVGSVETANLQASADYSFTLTTVDVDEQSGVRTASWEQETLAGSASWSDERLRTFTCNTTSVTDRELTSRSVSFGTPSDVAGGAMLTVAANGTYQLVISAVPLRSMGTEVVERWEYCGGSTYDRQEHAWGVPFLEFFIPSDVSQGAFTGTLASPSANTVVGSASGTQEFVVFSDGTENTTIPITYTLTWNLKLDP